MKKMSKQERKVEQLKNGKLEIIERKSGEPMIIKGYLEEKNGQTFFKIKAKKQYLDNCYPFKQKIELTTKKICIHCLKEIVVGDYQILIENGAELIVCPNAPECDGTVIDWWKPTIKNKEFYEIK